MRATLRYALSFALVFAAVALGAVLAFPQVATWYATFTLPSFTPPSYLFELAWIMLGIFLAIALARVWGCKETVPRRRWFFTFCLQLVLALLWLMLFFTFHAMFLAVVDIVVLWFIVAILTLGSYDIDRISFWLLVPYFASITFAVIFTAAIWWIN